MHFIVGIVVVSLLIAFFSWAKKKNQELNDSYPFDPREPKL